MSANMGGQLPKQYERTCEVMVDDRQDLCHCDGKCRYDSNGIDGPENVQADAPTNVLRGDEAMAAIRCISTRHTHTS